jgi:ribonuclease HI
MCQEIKAFADGSFDVELEFGGWGTVIQDENGTQEFKGTSPAKDIESIELKAITMALGKTPLHSKVTVYTDSLFIVNAFNCKIWKKYKACNDRSSQYLWLQLGKLLKNRIVTMMWIKGHSGIPEHNKADKLARDALFSSKRYLTAKEQLSTAMNGNAVLAGVE